jgi:hypothetical protein
MKDAYYFSHDSNARHDPKILGLISQFGMEGYGRYWVLIEMLREQEDYKLKKTKYLFNALAMQMQCDSNAAHDFAYACINEHELLVEDEDFIWSPSLKKRMENKDKKSDQAKKAAEARWKKTDSDEGSGQKDSGRNADAMRTHSGRNANKGKKKKGEQNKKEIDNAFESVWKEYPKKADKQNAYKKFLKKVKDDGIELVLSGTRAYIEETRKHETDQQFIKHYATFLNKESYKDYEQIDPVSPEKSELERVLSEKLNIEDTIALGRQYFEDFKDPSEYDQAVSRYEDVKTKYSKLLGEQQKAANG